MNEANVSSQRLDRLAEELPELTPEARKAATYVLENPLDVGVLTVREIADAANVNPNTVVRMARQIGFAGYDEFRAPFRDAIRNGTAGFPDRVDGCRTPANQGPWARFMPIWSRAHWPTLNRLLLISRLTS